MLIVFNQTCFEQCGGDSLIQTFDTPWPFAHGAQQLESVESLQDLAGPNDPVRMFEGPSRGWALITQHTQIMAVTLRAVAVPFQQQALQLVIVFTLEWQRIHIVMVSGGEQLTRFIRQLLIDPTRELTDPAALAEAPGVAQHDHLLGQRVGAIDVFMQAAALQRLTADRLQPLSGLRAVPATLGVTAQIPQYSAGLHRGQLVLVAQQNQACMGWQGIEQIGHHFQVDHRGFVDHQHIQWQAIAGVVAEMAGAGTAAQQAMHGGDVTRNLRPHLFGNFQRLHLLADGLGQPRRGLACRCRQTNPQRMTGSDCGRLKQGQQTHHRGGFAGTRTAGDDAEGTASGKGAGEFLPVDYLAGSG
ncbi:hypothetical protein D3C81_1213200 [compost metagenome]